MEKMSQIPPYVAIQQLYLQKPVWIQKLMDRTGWPGTFNGNFGDGKREDFKYSDHHVLPIRSEWIPDRQDEHTLYKVSSIRSTCQLQADLTLTYHFYFRVFI